MMMTTEEWRRHQEWAATPLGKLFYRFEATLGRAWITDSTSHSDNAMTRDWDAADKARAEFLLLLRGW